MSSGSMIRFLCGRRRAEVRVEAESRVLFREAQTRREIAAIIFARITEEYGIAPSAYEADQVFQRCLTLMHKFNIYEMEDFQPGHLEPFRNYLFPAS